jgi:hypothetical protein
MVFFKKQEATPITVTLSTQRRQIVVTASAKGRATRKSIQESRKRAMTIALAMAIRSSIKCSSTRSENIHYMLKVSCSDIRRIHLSSLLPSLSSQSTHTKHTVIWHQCRPSRGGTVTRRVFPLGVPVEPRHSENRAKG